MIEEMDIEEEEALRYCTLCQNKTINNFLEVNEYVYYCWLHDAPIKDVYIGCSYHTEED